jgi:hypothetical protein
MNGVRPKAHHREIRIDLKPIFIENEERQDLVENGNDEESAI